MDIFNILAVPTRRNIIERLAQEGTLSASDISNTFRVSAPAISQHLKILRQAGLVSVKKQGRERMYTLDIEGIYEFERWTKDMTDLWNKRFNMLEEVLQREKKKLSNTSKKYHGK